MKKAIKIGAFAFAGALLFASCKKDRTCVCTTGSLSASTTIENSSKKDAQEACEKGNVVLGGQTITSCELK